MLDPSVGLLAHRVGSASTPWRSGMPGTQHLGVSKRRVDDPKHRSDSQHKPPLPSRPTSETLDPESTLDLQRKAGNRAVAQLVGEKKPSTKDAKKKPAPKGPVDPPISMAMSREVQSIIANHPMMKAAEDLRAKGEEDEALDLLNEFWNKTEVTVKDEAGKDRKVKLAQFKPLMFTPAERRVLKIKKWRLAVRIKDWWDESVRRGEAHDPKPEKPEDDKSSAVNTVTSIVDTVGFVDKGGMGVSDVTSDLMPSNTKTPPSPKLGLKGTIKQELGELTDKKTISDSSDKNYEAKAFSNKAAWADGIFSILSNTITLVSSVTKIISKILDKKASKNDVAQEISNSLSNASATAGEILTVVEKARGSELTTHMFHWVPGLSIFTNGFTAITSGLSLVQTASRLFGVNQAKAKTTKKEDEDLSLALKRMGVRATQQVEQDSFNIAKSLTNTGLSIAEVATAGGFGIPRVAQMTVSAAGALHGLGHTIADSVRASATKSVRTAYFAAHEQGSAEKLIRTDPLVAAETIIGRAGERDKTAMDLLKAYDIKIPGLTAPSQKDELIKSGSGGGDRSERMFKYDAHDTMLYQEGLNKLMACLKESAQPETIGDKIKGVFNKIKETPGQLRDRYSQAKRIGDTRNTQDYGGKSNRGTGWAIKQTIFGGESGVKKLSETTALRVNEAFNEQKSGQAGPLHTKSFKPVTDEKARDHLLEKVSPEETLRTKKHDAKNLLARPPMTISGPMPEVTKAKVEAEKMPIGKLRDFIERGRGDMDPEPWKMYVTVFVERFHEADVTPKKKKVGAGK
jgi:hypothetical protein